MEPSLSPGYLPFGSLRSLKPLVSALSQSVIRVCLLLGLWFGDEAVGGVHSGARVGARLVPGKACEAGASVGDVG